MRGGLQKRARRPLEGVRRLGVSSAVLLLIPCGLAAQTSVSVHVSGVEDEVQENVLATLSLARAVGDTALDDDRIRRLHARASVEIAGALEPFGFYHSQVTANIAETGGAWRVSYAITPGPRVRVTSVQVRIEGEGAADAPFQAVRDSFPVAAGDPLDHRRYEIGRRRLLDVASSRGYLDARLVTSELRVDRQADTAAVVLQFTTGPRFRFGPVVFQQDVLNDNVLRRIVSFEEGQFYSTRPLLTLQSQLAATGYFAAVEVAPRRDLAEGLFVPIHVTPLSRRSRRYAVGGGFGTNTGVRGSLEAEFRRLNRSGHHADGKITASPLEQSIRTNYFIPGIFSNTRLLGLSASFAKLETETSHSRRLRLATSFSDRRGSWQEVLAVNFLREAFEVGVDTASTRLLTVSGAWSQTIANHPIFPRRGQRFRVRLEGSHERLLSDVRFVRANIDAKLITPIGDGARILTRAELGVVYSSDFRRLPPTVRFFAGGDESVRGFRYQALGPLDDAGGVIGGNSIALASIEIERTVFGRWAVAAFVDVGNALDDFSGRLESGAGIGLRWRSPVGPVRLDGAFPLSLQHSPLVLHFGIGPDL